MPLPLYTISPSLQVEALRAKLNERVGVAGADEEAPEVAQYRTQMAEYEARLQQSFEAKAHSQSGRLGEAMAGHHQLLRLPPKA